MIAGTGSEYGFTEEDWNHMVCEWMGLFYISIGKSDEWLRERFSGDLTLGDIGVMRQAWDALVAEMPHLADREK